MSYSLVPLNTTSIYPYKRTRYTETVVRNMTASSMFFGFLGSHGKRLQAYGDASLRDYHELHGNIENDLRGIAGHRNRRRLDHYLNALANNILRVTINQRAVYYAAVANATAFTKGDICWWDNSAKLAKPASAFTWTTDLLTTQTAFALVFLGVCLDNKTASDGKVVLRFDTSPLSAFDQTVATGTAYAIGQAFGPAKAAGNALLNNKVAAAVNVASCFQLVSDMSTTDAQVLVAPASAYYPHNAALALG